MKIVEFKLEGINGDEQEVAMQEAFDVLFTIYQSVLKEDKDWHFFYEGTYSFLRCGIDYKNNVKRWLDEHNVKYNQPIKEWKEPYDLTNKMQNQFSLVFHSLSVLVMELYFQNTQITEDLICYSADRVIHPFLNMATYLQYFKDNIVLPNWEANIMADLAIFRAYNNGKNIGWQDGVQHEKRIKGENK